MKTTVVLTDRNDGYKKLKRYEFSINSLIEAFDEIIFVDWNSPKQPLLSEIRHSISNEGKIKNYIVDENIAKRLNSGSEVETKVGSSIPCSVALNIAIRKSQPGEDVFLISTCADNIFPSREVIQSFLSTLENDTFYTVARREIPEVETLSFENYYEAREYYNSIINVVPQCGPGGCTSTEWFSVHMCPGDFQIAKRSIWFSILGFEEKMIGVTGSDSNVQKKALLNRFKLEGRREPAYFHINHSYNEDHNYENMLKNIESGYKWVENFSKSENSENWGYPEVEIPFEVI
jgi:hypothetical protein